MLKYIIYQKFHGWSTFTTILYKSLTSGSISNLESCFVAAIIPISVANNLHYIYVNIYTSTQSIQFRWLPVWVITNSWDVFVKQQGGIYKLLASWGLSQYKDRLSRNGDSHVKDVLSLTWDPFTGKTASLYLNGPRTILRKRQIYFSTRRRTKRNAALLAAYSKLCE